MLRTLDRFFALNLYWNSDTILSVRLRWWRLYRFTRLVFRSLNRHILINVFFFAGFWLFNRRVLVINNLRWSQLQSNFIKSLMGLCRYIRLLSVVYNWIRR